MIYYDYFLNIDIGIYQNMEKERGLIESVVIRLEDAKKILSILYNERQRFSEIEPSIEENFEKLESKCQLSSLLDENFGLIRANAAFEVDDDHFARAEDPNVEQKV